MDDKFNNVCDERLGVLEKLIIGIVVIVFVVLLLGVSYLVSIPVHRAFNPDGLVCTDDVCIHDWHIIESDVGLYDGYRVYCPLCENERTCSVVEFKKYQIHKERKEG